MLPINTPSLLTCLNREVSGLERPLIRVTESEAEPSEENGEESSTEVELEVIDIHWLEEPQTH